MTSPSPRKRVEVEEIGDVTVAWLTDRKVLEAAHIEAVGDQLTALVNDPARKKLVVNFDKVEFMSSAALGMLVTLQRKARAAAVKLVLCGIDPQILEVFKLTKLDKQFVIRADDQEALQAF